ncbi:aftiphilin-like isoform X3 [Palaemon carinicauda]
MAFQMIPPRVSSSPPPLDSLPSVACPGDDDEDEEFGTFATHNTFDITGLSDKLPPTPEHNPTTCLGEKNVALSLKDPDGTIGTSIAGGLPQPPGFDHNVTVYAKDINGEVSSSLEINEDGDDFGDFSFFTSTAAGGKTELGADDKASEEVQTGDIDSSQNCNLEPKVVDSSPNHSVSSFSMIATPPPLDHVIDNIVVDDEFSRISPNSPPVEDEEDDDFGDFTACTFGNSKDSSFPVVGTVKENVTPCQNSLEDCRPQIPDVSEHKPDFTCDVGLPGNESPVVSRKTSREEVCESHTYGESVPQNSCEVNSVDGYSEVHDRTRNPVGCNDDDSDSKECQLNKDKEITVCNEGSQSDSERDPSLHNLASSGPLTGRGTSSELSLPGEVENKYNRGFIGLGNNEDCLAQNLSITDNDDNDSRELESDDVSKGNPNEVSACPLNSEKDNVRTDYTEGLKGSFTLSKDTNGDEFECDWPSRDFKKAEDDDDDDDDLDFGDLREQVRSGKFGMNESSEADDDFGEFYDGTKMAPQVLNDDDDQEFGEFGTAVAEDEDAEFGDFAQVESNDGFANFSSQEGQILDKKAANESAFEEDEDEFGDFTSQQNVENQSDFRMPWQDHATSTSTKDSPVLKKLESLILKWIPREPVTSTFENQENRIVPTLFQSIEDDAFVWRQLENLEASAALTLSWGNTQAQTLYLSSVNVDARNIVSKSAMITLFGQKWSSSVPLFAQTLSFSPLTPAKPTENGSTLEGGNRGSVSPPILSSGLTPKFSASFRKDENEVQITSDDENAPEEQIPPAKFDWTSSGLTNPLEGPAYNSSLFDMDLLLSNSDIGKGATNALLASLEREFLSEGGEKSSVSRIKGPPTPSPLVQQILGSGKNSTQLAATPLQSLSTEIREVVENLPNIGFMRSRVLMFPIRGED